MSTKGKEDFDGTINGAGYKKSMDDTTKPPMTLIPPTLGIGIARVLGKGAAKYARGQWMQGMSFSEIASAIRRHLDAWEMGEEHDPDSGLPHIYHIGAELAFLSWFQHSARYAEYERFDDRLFKQDWTLVADEPKPREEAPVIAQGIRDWLGTNNTSGALDSIIADIAAEESLGPIEGCPCGECRTKQRAGVPCRDGETIR